MTRESKSMLLACARRTRAADLDDQLARLRWRLACLAFKAAAERFEALRRTSEA